MVNVHYESHNLHKLLWSAVYTGAYMYIYTCIYIHMYMYLIRDLLITNEMKGTKVLTLGAGH